MADCTVLDSGQSRTMQEIKPFTKKTRQQVITHEKSPPLAASLSLGRKKKDKSSSLLTSFPYPRHKN
jgi:hypothetical protein